MRHRTRGRSRSSGTMPTCTSYADTKTPEHQNGHFFPLRRHRLFLARRFPLKAEASWAWAQVRSSQIPARLCVTRTIALRHVSLPKDAFLSESPRTRSNCDANHAQDAHQTTHQPRSDAPTDHFNLLPKNVIGPRIALPISSGLSEYVYLSKKVLTPQPSSRNQHNSKVFQRFLAFDHSLPSSMGRTHPDFRTPILRNALHSDCPCMLKHLVETVGGRMGATTVLHTEGRGDTSSVTCVQL